MNFNTYYYLEEVQVKLYKGPSSLVSLEWSTDIYKHNISEILELFWTLKTGYIN